MGESLFVAGFVLTREDWDALGEDGREQILATLQRRAERPIVATAAAKPASASKVGPLPLPPAR